MQKITNDLLALAQNGDETAVAALIARMMPAIRKGAAAATAPGLDFEDAVQEGLIGLFEAMHRYDTAAGMAFASFAAACIALRKKHAPLNFSVPLPDAKELPQPGPDPEEQAIASEQYAATIERMQTELSPLERSVLLATLNGQTAAQIAQEKQLAPKAVANALARARRKLRGA